MKTINGRRVLVITPGDEYKPKVEGIKDFEASIFADKYQRAATLILEVLRANLKDNNQQDYPQHDCGQRVSGISPDYFNNIIVFDGERGSGKTSAVKSILLAFDALRCMKDNELNTQYYGEWRELKNEYSFNTSLDVIDPSMFEQNSNIIEVIISRMFKRTMEYLKDPCARTSNSNGGDIKSKLIELFSKVKENLAIMKNGDSVNRELGDSSIEILQKLACTSDLKLNLIELIEVYNKFIIGDKTKNVLVLCIDDLDMNIKSGFEMLDQIYKYLIIPNVIIIFGTKMQQLVRIVTDEFSAKAGIKQEEEYTRLMAENYLNKLLSPNHRLKLDYLSEDIGQYTIVIKEEKDATVDIFGVKVEDIVASQMPYEYLQESIAKLVYDYAGVEVVVNNNKTHPIIPRTLRRLCQLVTLLFQMKKNVSANNESIEVMINNLELFYHYLKNSWVPDNLSIAFMSIFDNWIELDEPDSKKWLVQELIELVGIKETIQSEKRLTSTERSEFLRLISSIKSNPVNITLGDMHYFLESCRRYSYQEEIIKAVFAFEQVYMIKLCRAYYQLRKELLKKQRNTETIEETDKVYRSIKLILGGALISPDEYKLLPSKEDFGRRDLIEINLEDIYSSVMMIINNPKLQAVKEIEDNLIKLCAIEMLYLSIYKFESKGHTVKLRFEDEDEFSEVTNYYLGNNRRKYGLIYLPQLLTNQFRNSKYRNRHWVLQAIDGYRETVKDTGCNKVLVSTIKVKSLIESAIIKSERMPSFLQWNTWIKSRAKRINSDYEAECIFEYMKELSIELARTNDIYGIINIGNNKLLKISEPTLIMKDLQQIMHDIELKPYMINGSVDKETKDDEEASKYYSNMVVSIFCGVWAYYIYKRAGKENPYLDFEKDRLAREEEEREEEDDLRRSEESQEYDKPNMRKTIEELFEPFNGKQRMIDAVRDLSNKLPELKNIGIVKKELNSAIIDVIKEIATNRKVETRKIKRYSDDERSKMRDSIMSVFERHGII